MHITFTPQRFAYDAGLSLEKSASDQISINGEWFDFDTLEEGDIIPSGRIPSDFIFGDVRRQDGVVSLNLLLPSTPSLLVVPSVDVEDAGPIIIPSPEENNDVEP